MKDVQPATGGEINQLATNDLAVGIRDKEADLFREACLQQRHLLSSVNRSGPPALCEKCFKMLPKQRHIVAF
jgi:hypothetical protein